MLAAGIRVALPEGDAGEFANGAFIGTGESWQTQLAFGQ